MPCRKRGKVYHGRNQLIANKKTVNRPKDQLDVTQLEKIVELRKEMGLD
jgi:hypothetical protein